MLTRIWFALAVLIVISGCAKTYETREYTLEDSLPPQPTAADFQQCPDGHKALKDVPIMAGLLWMTPELERKIQNREVWAAGCSPMGNYKSKIVCSECGFAYEPVFQHWERRSEDPADFHRPLLPLIRDFPRASATGLASLANYYQQIRDNQVEGESIIYWTRDSYDQISQQVLQYFKTSGLEFDVERGANARYPQKMKLHARWHDRFIYVEVSRHGEMNQTLVSVEALNETAAKRKDPLLFLAQATAEQQLGKRP